MKKRIAARAVIIDNELNTPVISVRNGVYFKIPGGKIEDGENLEAGLRREIKEEAGCEVEILNKIGESDFFIKEKNLLNHSICYLAKLVGERGKPNFDKEELERDFSLSWMNIDKAIETFENCPLITDNNFELTIHRRDLGFLKKARDIIEKQK